jgi:hypothetical protein
MGRGEDQVTIAVNKAGLQTSVIKTLDVSIINHDAVGSEFVEVTGGCNNLIY